MAAKPSKPTPVGEPDGVDRGPVMRLTKPVKVAVAAACVALVVAHVVWPTKVDATFIGLLVVAVIVPFFDIESIDALGIHARSRREQLARAESVVEAFSASAEPIEIPPAPEVPGGEAIAVDAQGVVHREPFELMPPSDPA